MFDGLNASISLTDNMTAPLRDIANAVSLVSANMAEMAKNSNALSPDKLKNMQAATQKLDRSVSALESSTRTAVVEQAEHNKQMATGATNAGNLGRQEGQAADEQERLNSAMDSGTKGASKLTGGFRSLVTAIGSAVAGYVSLRTAAKAIQLSDELAQTTSRLNMVNDGMQTTAELQEKIFQAAQNSRGSYQDMADIVAKLGTNARDAFASNDEMVAFAEQLNKQFVLAGASAEATSGATLQLTQALASGVLRGDELNSVFEAAPTVIQTIADYLQVPIGSIREMATEGELTADIVKNAMLAAADSTNSKFDSMSMTFSQLWQNFQNQATHAAQPVMEALNGIANNPALSAAFNELGQTLENLAPKVVELVNSANSSLPSILGHVSDALQFFVDHGDDVGLAISQIAGAFIALKTYAAVSSVITPVVTAVNALMAAEEGLTVAQALLNVVMSANPLLLIVGLLGAVTAGVIYLWNTNEGFRNAVIEMWNGVKELYNEAVTTVTNNVNALGAAFQSVGAKISTWWNETKTKAQGCVDGIKSMFSEAVTTVSNNMSDLGAAIQGGGAAIANWWSQLCSDTQSWINDTKSWGVNIIQGFINGIEEKWQEVTGSLSAKWEEIVTNVKNFFGIHSPSDVFIGIGGNIVEGLKSGIESAWTNFTSWLGGLWDTVTDWGEGLFGGGDSVDVSGIEDAKTRIEQLRTDIGSILTGIQSDISVTGEEIANATRDAFQEASLRARIQVSGMRSGVAAELAGIPPLFENTFSQIAGTVQDLPTPHVDWSVTVSETQAGLAELNTAVQTGFDGVKATAAAASSETAASTSSAFSAMASQVRTDVTNLGQAVSDGLGTIPAAALSAYTLARENAAAQLELMRSDARTSSADIAEAAASGLSGLAERFKKTFADIQAETLAALQATATGAVDSANEMAQGMTTAFSAMSTQVVATATGMATETELAFSDMTTQILIGMTTFRGSFIAVWEAVKTGTLNVLTTLTPGVVAKIAAMVTAVLNEAGKLPGKFNEIGHKMMENLKVGIDSQKQKVIDTTNELVTQIKTTFETGLGIHSPSAYLTWVGEMMGQGLINGLSESDAVAFAEKTIEDMKSSFEAGKFNADELVNYLDENTVMALVGKISEVDTSAVQQAAASASIVFPLIGTRGTQSSWFGYRPPEDTGGIGTTNHSGADLATAEGTPIAAAIGGTVTTASWYGGYGNAVVIDSGGGLEIVYGHMSAITTTQGATVQAGQQIGLVGSTGNSTGPHLHFEMRQNGEAFDPQPYLDGSATLPPGVGVGTNPLAAAILAALNRKKGIGAGSVIWEGNIPYDISAGAEQWRGTVQQALQMTGQNVGNNVDLMLYAIQCESGGDPNAINMTDSNAAAGINSRGLMQTIPGTFQAYAYPGYDQNIYDPLSNILAAIRYILDRYNSIPEMVIPRMGPDGWYGYAKGTKNADPGYHWVGEEGPELVKFRGGEEVIPHRESLAIAGSIAPALESSYYSLTANAANTTNSYSAANTAGSYSVTGPAYYSASAGGNYSISDAASHTANTANNYNYSVAGPSYYSTSVVGGVSLVNPVTNNAGARYSKTLNTGATLMNGSSASTLVTNTNITGGTRTTLIAGNSATDSYSWGRSVSNSNVTNRFSTEAGTVPRVTVPPFTVPGAQPVSLEIARPMTEVQAGTAPTPMQTAAEAISVPPERAEEFGAEGGGGAFVTVSAPINLTMNPVINNSEEMRMTLSEFESMLETSLNRVIDTAPDGYYSMA